MVSNASTPLGDLPFGPVVFYGPPNAVGKDEPGGTDGAAPRWVLDPAADLLAAGVAVGPAAGVDLS